MYLKQGKSRFSKEWDLVALGICVRDNMLSKKDLPLLETEIDAEKHSTT